MSLRTPHKTAWEKGTVPVLLRGLRKRGTVPGGFVRGSKYLQRLFKLKLLVLEQTNYSDAVPFLERLTTLQELDLFDPESKISDSGLCASFNGPIQS